MAGGFIPSEPVREFDAKLTFAVYVTCIIAATGGLILGYDVGISGGVTTMESFLTRFFPEVWDHMINSRGGNEYCMFNSQVLTAFTSSLYIAGLVGALAVSHITKTSGRRFTMLLGGLTFLAGAALNAAAVNVAMLIIGRILLGFGVGFTTQATPVYLSETAPPKWRGALNSGFQLFLALGVIAAGLINYGTAQIPNWGWRLSLGLAGAPALIMTLGVFFVPDSASSLIERGKIDEARAALKQIRGSDANIEPEMDSLFQQCERSKAVGKPYRNILQRRYRPQLVMAVAIPMFTQLTGINIIAFYAPALFQSVGFGNKGALIAAVVFSIVHLFAVLTSSFFVDRLGRRVLLIQGSIQMSLFQIAVAVALAILIGSSGLVPLTHSQAIIMLVLMCAYVAGFGWSWGPLQWLIPSEIFPLEIRPAGQSISVAVNFLITFVLSQTFLAMLCSFKYGSFLFYSGWLFIMALFIAVFFPETKGVPLEDMETVWMKHWYWRRYYVKDDHKVASTTTTA